MHLGMTVYFMERHIGFYVKFCLRKKEKDVQGNSQCFDSMAQGFYIC